MNRLQSLELVERVARMEALIEEALKRGEGTLVLAAGSEAQSCPPVSSMCQPIRS